MEQRRKCIACGEIKPKSKLIKITKEYSCGDIIIEPNSKTFGRSAYVCKNEECLNSALKKNKLNKFLKTSANIDKDTVINSISKYLNK